MDLIELMKVRVTAITKGNIWVPREHKYLLATLTSERKEGKGRRGPAGVWGPDYSIEAGMKILYTKSIFAAITA